MDTANTLKTPFAVFVGDVDIPGFAKTGYGMVEWRNEDCAGQIRLNDETVDLGIADLSMDSIHEVAKAIVIGSAPRGGILPASWTAHLCSAAQRGIDIVSGLHEKLADIPELVEAAEKGGANLWDVRVPPTDLPIGTGTKRTGKRLLTVGTDCVAGKKYTALAIAREMKTRGIKSTFRATGQTGIIIAGTGIPLDAVVCDFTAGAAEVASPENDHDHWDVIEGQGSLFHPSFAGVSLGLLHGSQPDAIVLCHNPSRPHILGLPAYPIPDVQETIERNLEAGRLTNPKIRCVGISINSSQLDTAAAAALKAELSEETDLPCIDPLSDGPGLLVDALGEIE